MTPVLVSATWLRDNLSSVRVFDASSHLPTVKRNAAAEFAAAHIPGALRFDIETIADPDHAMPHMVPSPDGFAAAMRDLGLGDDDHVVFYDDCDIRTAARGWWMMRLFGHERVSILDGGLAAWRGIHGTLDSGDSPPVLAGDFTSRPSVGVSVVDFDSLSSRISDGSAGQILDARAAARFAGEAPEPRPGLRAGHIPGSRNLPFSNLLNEDGTWKDNAAIRELFTAAGIDPTGPVTASCGSGVTACVLAAGLVSLGNENVTVYDGSWTEWGSSDAPIETGPAS